MSCNAYVANFLYNFERKHFSTTQFKPIRRQASAIDEIKYAQIITILSISFVICWMPQMVRELLNFFFRVLNHLHPCR